MRKLMFLSVCVLGACAGRVQSTTLAPMKTTYSCNGRSIHHAGDSVMAAEAQLAVGWRDDEGKHYVAWPTRTTTMEAVEYVIPSDTRQDAIERVYDTSQGTSRVDWRMVTQSVCTASGGYNDALARFATGKSFDQVARDLELSDKGEARELVHTALLRLQKRYYKDR
ncbi:MAG: hypothetical protein ABI867_03400 [Kofleriaceae bacterium]